MSTLLKPLKVREELLKRKIRMFTGEEFIRIFQVPFHSAKYFLENQVHQGFLTRLKNGLYILQTDPPGEEEIANRLYQPSYISFEYALAYHNRLMELPYHLTSATTKPTRLFALPNLSFAYYTIKKEAYTGYILVEKNYRRFLIAEAEKAFVDYLYYVTLGKRVDNDRFRMSGLDKKKVLKYAALYKRESLVKLVEKRL